MSAPFYAVFGTFIALAVIAVLCDRWTKRHRPNKRRKGFLGAPDPKCVVGQGWKAYRQTGHRF